VEDVITNPPPTSHYERIKAELIRRLSLSEQQRLRQFLMHEMGDRRTTQFLRHLRTLVGPSVPSDFLRTLWTNHLQPNIQAITVMQAQVALQDMAQLADKIAEVTPSPCVPQVSSSGDDICILTARIDEMFKGLATASHVFLWHGALRGALQAPYVGPYRVFHRGDKTCSIEVQSAAKTVSIDRLKPAYVLHVNTESILPPAIPSSIMTRSGRRVGFSDYLGVQRSQRGVVWWTPLASPPT